jgi:RNA polymerase sigma-70 factor (ECF subfamily)
MESPTSTFGLLARIEAGEQTAITDLFGKYQKRLSLLLSYKVGERLRQSVSIQDLLQETLLRAYKSFRDFDYRGPGSFMNWLSTIADHVVSDQVRSLERKKRKASLLRFRSDTNPHGPEPETSLTPGRVFEGREGIEHLKKALDALPDNYRQVIILARVQGYRTSEIAKYLQKSPEQVSLLLHRALKRFRQLYCYQPEE